MKANGGRAAIARAMLQCTRQRVAAAQCYATAKKMRVRQPRVAVR